MQYVDPSINYEDVAKQWAQQIDQSFPTDPHQVNLCIDLMTAVWSGIYPETFEFILADPHSFAQRVAEYRHGMSITKEGK